MDFVTITDHDTIDGCLADRGLARYFHQRTGYDIFSAGSVQDSSAGLGNFRSAARTKSSRCARTFSTCRRYLQKRAIAHAVAHPLYSINGKLEASHLERLILLFKHFEGINGLRDALLSELAQQLLRRPDAAENRRVRQPARSRADPSPSRGKKFSPAARTITAGCSSPPPSPKRRAAETAGGISRTRPRRAIAQRTAKAGLRSRFPTDSTTPLSCFIQDRFTEKLGPSAPLLETDVLALHGRARSDRVHAARKSDLHRARRDVGKNFRAGQAGQRFALERALRDISRNRK